MDECSLVKWDQNCNFVCAKYNLWQKNPSHHFEDIAIVPCLKHGGSSISMRGCFYSTRTKSWWGRSVDPNTKRPTASCKRREAGVVVHSLGQWTQAHNEICKGRDSDQSRINLLEWLSESPNLKTNECLWQDFKIAFQLLSILSDWASAIFFFFKEQGVMSVSWSEKLAELYPKRLSSVQGGCKNKTNKKKLKNMYPFTSQKCTACVVDQSHKIRVQCSIPSSCPHLTPSKSHFTFDLILLRWKHWSWWIKVWLLVH